MASLCWKGFALVLVWYMTVHICSAAVSGTTCDPTNSDGTSGGAAVCTKADVNAECKTGANKCSCKTGYKEGSQDSNTCVLLSVSETVCNPAKNDAQTDASAVCQAVDTNAECPEGTTKCACKTGYKQDATNGNTCVAVLTGSCSTNDDCTGAVPNSECSTSTCSCVAGFKSENNLCTKAVSGTLCTPGDNDQAGASAVCKAVDTNAECKAGASACSCKTGYKEGSKDSNTCVLKPVSETACQPSNNDSQTGGTAVCTAVDTNAECKTGASACSCKSGYKDGSQDTHACVLISVAETDCDPSDDDATTGGAAVCKAVDTNAECPDKTTKCACKAGYKQDATNVNTCVTDPGSSATSPWMTTSVIGTCLLTVLLTLVS